MIRGLINICWDLFIRDRRFISSWLRAPRKKVLYAHLDILIAVAVHGGIKNYRV
jgi:hypothetical protein